MQKKYLAFALPLLLAGCVTPGGDAPASGDGTAGYFALGTEPFWNVEINDRWINFHDAAGTRLRVANPGARPSFNGERYVTPTISVDVTHQRCTDGMSDRHYRDTVSVDVDGRHLSGCGGPAERTPAIEGQGWRIIAINGRDVVGGRGDPAELNFRGGQLSGTAGCNRLSGSYQLAGSRISFGPILSTRMACPALLMAQENALLALLSGPLAVTSGDNGEVLLSREGVGQIRLGAWLN